MKPFKLHLLIFFFAIATIMVNAQSLPGKQESSVWLPSTVKIDGKANEWGNKFQAYNRATDIFYTIANDTDELYLVVQANNPDVINRITDGGVTLTIKKSKNLKDNMSFTYPVNNSKTAVVFNLKMTYDTAAKAADSLMMRNNKVLGEKCKWIRVTGVVGVDTLLSVYNEDDIKASGLFNNKKVYTFEMSIKLKLMHLSASDGSKFSYQLKVNGMRVNPPITKYTVLGGGTIPPEALAQAMAEMNAKFSILSVPTDFSGEYTLVKRP